MVNLLLTSPGAVLRWFPSTSVAAPPPSSVHAGRRATRTNARQEHPDGQRAWWSQGDIWDLLGFARKRWDVKFCKIVKSLDFLENGEVLWDFHPQDLAINDGHVVRTLVMTSLDLMRFSRIWSYHQWISVMIWCWLIDIIWQLSFEENHGARVWQSEVFNRVSMSSLLNES